METLSEHYMDNVAWFDRTLGVGRSSDMVSRDYVIGGRRARIWVVDGYGKDGTLERMGAFWLSILGWHARHRSCRRISSKMQLPTTRLPYAVFPVTVRNPSMPSSSMK